MKHAPKGPPSGKHEACSMKQCFFKFTLKNSNALTGVDNFELEFA